MYSTLPLAVFGLAGLLALISLLPRLAAALGVPLSVVLAAIGCVLGVAIGTAPFLPELEPLAVVADFLRSLGTLEITSAVFLWVFLPLLLFETALQLDIRDLLEDAVPILVLAVFAVVVTTFVAGAALFWVSSYALAACLLLGAIVATTDPVAVVAIFREVGAPRRLSLLVEGESLLNDAAAIALFSTLFALVIGARTGTSGEMAAAFLWDFLAGAAAGAVAGRLAGLLVGRLDSGGPAEITASVALAYLAYGLTEFYVGGSGVVAAVAAGLVFGSALRTRLSSRERAGLFATWGQIGFWASSLLFVLASLLVPDTLARAGLGDLLLVLVLVVATLLARAAVMFLVLPALAALRLSPRVEPRYSAVVVWGGLRGAVTLALALAVGESPFVPADAQHLVTVVATGYVLFTLFVQAPSLRFLIRLLGLDRLPPVELYLRERALALMRREIETRIDSVAATYGIEPAATAEVRQLYESGAEEAPQTLPDDMVREQLAAALRTLTAREFEMYLDEVSDRLISRRVGNRLLRNAGLLADAIRQEGFHGYRRAARRLAAPDAWTRGAMLLHRRFRIHRPLARHLADRMEQLLVNRHVLQGLQRFAEQELAAVFGERVTETACLFLAQRLENTERSLDALRLQYPDYWRRIEVRYLVRVALRLERDGYRRMLAEGLLSPRVHGHLLRTLQDRERALARVPALDLGLDVHTLVRKVPIFRNLPEARLRELCALVQPRLALPGEHIVRRGERGDEMYFIASGAVEVVVEPEPVRLGTGDFFGELALFTDRPRQADVVAIGYCELLVLSRDAFRRFIHRHPELTRHLRAIARERIEANART